MKAIAYHNHWQKNKPILHGAYIGTLGLVECKKYVLYVIRKR